MLLEASTSLIGNVFTRTCKSCRLRVPWTHVDLRQCKTIHARRATMLLCQKCVVQRQRKLQSSLPMKVAILAACARTQHSSNRCTLSGCRVVCTAQLYRSGERGARTHSAPVAAGSVSEQTVSTGHTSPPAMLHGPSGGGGPGGPSRAAPTARTLSTRQRERSAYTWHTRVPYHR